MCVLDACCYCIFLDIGCMLIAAVILVFRTLIVVAMLNHPHYKDFRFTEDFSASHATILIAVAGCIVPICLMWGVCTASPGCVCAFIILEIVYLIVSLVWEMYFIVRYFRHEEHFDGNHDTQDPYFYEVYDYIDYDYIDYDYIDYDYYYHDYTKKPHEYLYNYYNYYETQGRKHYFDDDYYWLGPLIFFLVEGYFLWVAYSYYTFLMDEYDSYGEPAIFYT